MSESCNPPPQARIWRVGNIEQVDFPAMKTLLSVAEVVKTFVRFLRFFSVTKVLTTSATIKSTVPLFDGSLGFSLIEQLYDFFAISLLASLGLR